jgi:hypothetical protein
VATLTAVEPGIHVAEILCTGTTSSNGVDGVRDLYAVNEVRTFTMPGGLSLPGDPAAAISLAGNGLRIQFSSLPEGSECGSSFTQTDGKQIIASGKRTVQTDASGMASIVLSGTKPGVLVAQTACYLWNADRTQQQLLLAEARTLTVGG